MLSDYVLPILGIVVAVGYFGMTGGFGSSSSTNQPTYGGKKNKSKHNRHKHRKSSTSKKR